MQVPLSTADQADANDPALDDLASALDKLSVAKTQCELCTEPLSPSASGRYCSGCADRMQMAERFKGLQLSTKTSKIMELLEEIAAEDPVRPKKTIIFSQVSVRSRLAHRSG